MNILSAVICLLFGSCFSQFEIIRNMKFERHPDSFLTLPRVIRKYGYPLETHKVVTEDGYILRSLRIPHGRQQPQKMTNRSAVLLLHGLGGSPDHFVVLGPDRGLPYYLADQGFDVWLLSSRGSWNSGGHLKYNWDIDQKYWDFSWHHIGVYDIRAYVEYVIEQTGQEKVFYVGHSSGGTSYFALSSEIPEIANKIKIAVGMATAAYMKWMDSPLMKLFASSQPLVQAITEIIGTSELPFYKWNAVLNELIKILCSEVTVLGNICTQVLNTISSHDSVIFDKKLISFVMSSMPARVSLKHIFHFCQLINSGRFAKYDFGLTKNRRIYGTTSPPDYNISNSRAPVALFYGPRDYLSHPRGVLELASKLPHLILVQRVSLDDFNHLDFLFGTNATELVYKDIATLFTKYDKGIVPAKIKITDFSYK